MDTSNYVEVRIPKAEGMFLIRENSYNRLSVLLQRVEYEKTYKQVVNLLTYLRDKSNYFTAPASPDLS